MELLIVVAIIAILAGVLIPSLARAQAQARLASCKSNLHHVAQAHSQYDNEFNGRKPPLLPTTERITPNVKYRWARIGQGLLVPKENHTGYIAFATLLCPAASMNEDAAWDQYGWDFNRTSGSSYPYLWRDETLDLNDPGKGITYQRAIYNGRSALTMDINCEQGHPYQGAYQDRAWVSHPLMDAVNVAFVGGNVGQGDNAEILLAAPGTVIQQRQWFDEAHELK